MMSVPTTPDLKIEYPEVAFRLFLEFEMGVTVLVAGGEREAECAAGETQLPAGYAQTEAGRMEHDEAPENSGRQQAENQVKILIEIYCSMLGIPVLQCIGRCI